MKQLRIAILAARILLGLMFFIFGLNGILQFMHAPPLPGDGGIWAGLMMAHKYMTFIALLQVIGGLLLLVGRFVPLGLTILAPILVNVLLFHILFAVPGIAMGLFATLLELFLIYVYRLSFRGLFDANPEVA